MKESVIPFVNTILNLHDSPCFPLNHMVQIYVKSIFSHRSQSILHTFQIRHAISVHPVIVNIPLSNIAVVSPEPYNGKAASIRGIHGLFIRLVVLLHLETFQII